MFETLFNIYLSLVSFHRRFASSIKACFTPSTNNPVILHRFVSDILGKLTEETGGHQYYMNRCMMLRARLREQQAKHQEQLDALGQELQQFRTNPPPAGGANECVLSMENNVEVAFVPCGHLCVCVGCATGLAQCPICRHDVERELRVYMS